MKYLSEYMGEKQTLAFNRADAFFAFSDKQFEEAKKEGIKYVSLGAGLICNSTKAKTLTQELDTIYTEAIQEDVQDNGMRSVIDRELANHEAYYTRDIESTVEALKDYPCTIEEILKVFREEQPNNVGL